MTLTIDGCAMPLLAACSLGIEQDDGWTLTCEVERTDSTRAISDRFDEGAVFELVLTRGDERFSGKAAFVAMTTCGPSRYDPPCFIFEFQGVSPLTLAPV